jgi:hypothetical protein
VTSKKSPKQADPTVADERWRQTRELRAQWQYAAELLLAEADVSALSKAVELALFYDAKLDVAKMPAQ